MMCYKNLLKKFAINDEGIDIINRSFPIKRSHRKSVVFTVMCF